MSEKRNVPQLRFPGFNDEWKSAIAGTLFSISAGGDIPKENVSHQQTEYFPYPIFANAAEGKGLYGYSDVFKMEPPALTIAGRGVNVGISHVRSTRFFPIVRLLVLKPKRNDLANLRFFETAFNNLNIFLESTGVPQLTVPQISSYTLTFPSLAEQQKIAEFLTAVDRRIELLQAKKEKLEVYKKGVMHLIFSQKLRFKADDGSDFPDWETRELSEIVSNKSIKFDPSKAKQEIKCIELEHISSETGRLLGYVDGSKQGSIKSRFKKGDVLFGKLRPYLKKYLLAPFDGVCTSEIWVLQGSSEINNGYLYNLVQTSKFIASANLSSGSKMPRADWSYVSSISYKIPSIPEQTKIVQFLTSLDRSIENLNQQITLTQTWKKGLLQKMFV